MKWLLLLTLFSVSLATPVIVSGYSTTLSLYDFNSTGRLNLQSDLTVPSPLTYWAQHPTNPNVLYAVLEGVPDGLVKSFVISRGAITETSSVAVGAGPVHVTVDSQGIANQHLNRFRSMALHRRIHNWKHHGCLYLL